MLRYLYFTCSLLLCIPASSQTRKVTLSSPNKNITCEIGLLDHDLLLIYKIFYKNKPITNWSSFGILGRKIVIERTERKTRNEKFAWPLGEDDSIENHYNEVKIYGKAFNVIMRAYDGSIAFRYELLQPHDLKRETTQYNFLSSYSIYQYNQESIFKPMPIDSLAGTCDLPATLTNGQYYISLGEADNRNYTKAELKKGKAPNCLEITWPRDTLVKVATNYLTPWRTISVSESAIGLHHFSTLNLKLVSPAITTVPNWIKPGKLIRAQLTTQAGIDCIDFAAAHNFQYIMYDAGWYGAEFRSSSDPAQVIPAIDMQKVIDYGKQKGIGVILYVNYVGLRAKLDTILPLYKKWGVAGLKFGFVDGLTQQGLTWLTQAMQKVYDHGFILNIHDNYKPTGLSRSFPQLLTQEGIRGDENSPDAFHNTVLPFTRFLAGPADFTFCYPNTTNSYSKNIKVSMAQQLALTVVYFSPLQAIFWYGKPAEYTNEKEIEFFKYVPTVWNESHYLAGDIGKNISVARRSNDTWFIGNVAGLGDWQSNIKLHFLQSGKIYEATIYEDDGNGSIAIRTMPVKKDEVFNFTIKASGGQAIIIR